MNPSLSIVTVTFNDAQGLKETASSVLAQLGPQIEYWVIDGDSKDSTKQFLSQPEQHWIQHISEPDDGLYDAMNKGLEKVTADYVLFVNAGDILYQDFSWEHFLQSTKDTAYDKVLIGQTIETYKNSRYLRPGHENSELAFKAPPHQATFYPRNFFSQARFRIDYPVGADGEYTCRAITSCGAKFVPVVVSEFLLGGLSSNYGSMSTLRLRWQETTNFREAVKLFSKVILWHSVPRSLFYEILSKGKYTKLS